PGAYRQHRDQVRPYHPDRDFAQPQPAAVHRPVLTVGIEGRKRRLDHDSTRQRAQRAGSGAEGGDDGLAGNRRLADRGARHGSLGQIDVEARAETDKAEAFAGINGGALGDEAENPARHQARNLHHADPPARAVNYEAVALVLIAGLVELGIEELAGAIGDARDLAAYRSAVHM